MRVKQLKTNKCNEFDGNAALARAKAALQVRLNISRGINDLNVGRVCTLQELLERYRSLYSNTFLRTI